MKQKTRTSPQTTVRVSDELAQVIGLIAKAKRSSIHEFLDKTILPILRKQAEKILRDKVAELGSSD